MGLGIALQSREAVELELDAGRRLATISPRGVWRAWHVVSSTVGPSSDAVEEFIEFVRSADAREALARPGPQA